MKNILEICRYEFVTDSRLINTRITGNFTKNHLNLYKIHCFTSVKRPTKITN